MTNETINVGDAVLFISNRGAQFEPCKVTKVTKATFAIDKELKAGRTAPHRFNLQHRTYWTSEGYLRCYESYRPNRYGSERHELVLLDTPENRSALQEEADRQKEEQESKKAEQARKEIERQQRWMKETKEVMDAMGCMTPDDLPPMRKEILPDGSRLYSILMPVKAEHAERKGGYERLFVRCMDVKELDWVDSKAQEKTVVESAYTYCNASTSSFSSVSHSRYENDQQALWDSMRRQYHSW